MTRYMLPALMIVSAFLAGRASTGESISIPWPDLIPSIVTEKPPLPSDVPRLLYVYETDDKFNLTVGHRSQVDSAPYRQWLRDQGYEFRVFDRQQDQKLTGSEWFFQALGLNQDTQFLYAVNGDKFYLGPWPDDIEAAKKIIEGLK